MLHKLVDCCELSSEGQFGPVFYLRRHLVVRLNVETGEKPVYPFRYTDAAVLIGHGREMIRSVAGIWTHSQRNVAPTVVTAVV